MFCIKIADITVEMDNRYGYAEKACFDYVVEYASARPDFRVRATSAEIDERVCRTNNFLSREKAEFYVLFDKICKLGCLRYVKSYFLDKSRSIKC